MKTKRYRFYVLSILWFIAGYLTRGVIDPSVPDPVVNAAPATYCQFVSCGNTATDVTNGLVTAFVGIVSMADDEAWLTTTNPASMDPIEVDGPDIRWLQSVVTEAWRRTGPNAWESVSPAYRGQVGDCTTIIGLREDGVVVWRNREEAKGANGFQNFISQ